MDELSSPLRNYRSALGALGHDLNSYAVLAELGLSQCKLCAKVWKALRSENAFEPFTVELLGIVIPSGWSETTVPE